MRPRTPFPFKLFAKKIAGKKTSRLGVFYVCATDGFEYDWQRTFISPEKHINLTMKTS